jgi:hypothetical protein
MNDATAWQADKGKGTGCQHQPVPTIPGTGCIVDPSYCNFDSILEAQASGMAVFVRFHAIPAARLLPTVHIWIASERSTIVHDTDLAVKVRADKCTESAFAATFRRLADRAFQQNSACLRT